MGRIGAAVVIGAGDDLAEVVLGLGEVVSLIVGLGRGATRLFPPPDARVNEGAGGGARTFIVVVHAVETSDSRVDARLVDLAYL